MKTQHFFIDLTQRPPPELSRSFGQPRGFGTHARQGPGDPRREEWRIYFNSPTDQRLVQFLGFDPDALLKELATGKGEGEILEWVQAHSKTPRSAWEIEAWSAFMDKRAPDTARRNPCVLCRTPEPAFQNPGRRQNLVRIRRTR
jgi:hypothetical protein